MTLPSEILAMVLPGQLGKTDDIRMKAASRFLCATALVFLLASLTLATSTLADRAPPPSPGGGGYSGAPGPIVGAGLPLLAIGGVGYGVYWLVKRRRKVD